jgi:hypothetical protein
MARRFREAEQRARRQQLGLWHVEKRIASTRQWQIAQPTVAVSVPSQAAETQYQSVYSSSLRASSSSGRRLGHRGRSRAITVEVEFSSRPTFGYGRGFGGFGTTQEFRASPR